MCVGVQISHFLEDACYIGLGAHWLQYDLILIELIISQQLYFQIEAHSEVLGLGLQHMNLGVRDT